MSPQHASWTSAEESAFVDFLFEHRAEAGDGGNFKATTFQKALTHIAPFFKRGAAKSVKNLRNKWNNFRRVYRVIQAIKLVSGWVWDDTTGATITVDTAASWDDYVKKHPEAKPFRNKGWPYFSKISHILPSTAAGANIFHPTTDPDNSSERSSSPDPGSTPPDSSEVNDTESSDREATPPPPSRPTFQKRAREAATPSQPPAKRVRASQGAAALQSMSASIADFGTAISAALAPPPPPAFDPSPVRRTAAVAAVLRLEADWLSTRERVTLIDFLRSDRTATEIYLALDEADVRKEWVRCQLEKLGIIV
ncbi:hypothetical protein CVT26_006439 [Gymnopilus dilepis]|uniref:Myb/SANT-like domain-containing protein n=1 Tax=Gymnopilus dilepis TaxID=231916 RepID=A0A409Y221_9AGAR|nr:hypothetical protein CVT26_006439 [Gymnopilus dilepis]